MESKVVRRFIEQVNELVPESEGPSIFDALKRYQSSMELKRLIEDLKIVLDEPSKLEIFEYIRPLIPPKHQVEYDNLAPAPPGRKLRSINLRRHGNESFGFAVRGGFEHGIGIFVSQVDPGSQAEVKGLRVGDEIVRVNGFTIAEAIHDEVLNLIKGREEIELKVTNIGMLPMKERATDPITWSYVDKKDAKRSSRRGGQMLSSQKKPLADDVKLFVNLRSAPSLGCSILSGPRHFPGIYVERVKPGSLGKEIGIEVGDQIIEVNGTSFQDISHKEAVVALKSSKELHITIRKATGLPLVQRADQKEEPQPLSPVTVHPPPSIPSTPNRNNSPDVDKSNSYTAPDRLKVLEEDLIAAELRRQESRRWREGFQNEEKEGKDTFITHTVVTDPIEESDLESHDNWREDDEETKDQTEKKENIEQMNREEEMEKERLKLVVEEKLEKQRIEAELLRQELIILFHFVT